jgi:hypothetical protein
MKQYFVVVRYPNSTPANALHAEIRDCVERYSRILINSSKSFERSIQNLASRLSMNHPRCTTVRAVGNQYDAVSRVIWIGDLRHTAAHVVIYEVKE